MPAIRELNPAIKDVEQYWSEHGTPALNRRLQSGGTVNPEEWSSAALDMHGIFGRHETMFLNANTGDVGLKRQVLMQKMLRSFKRQILPVSAFSTVFNNVPLQGLDTIDVPYYALHTAASTDYDQNNGYVFNGNSTSNVKEITINKRKYQPFDFSSNTFRRSPWFNVLTLAELRAEKLASDVVADILSVITLANFGASVIAKPAETINSGDIAGLRTAANLAMWPRNGRSLVIDSAYDGVLVQDPSIKSALNFGNPNAIQDGVINKLYGFDYFESPSIPDNGENLKGFATFKSGILCATSPIMPAPGVQKNLLVYDMTTDPDTGLTIEYRYWGEPQADTDREVIECNYGYTKGEAAAIKRITSI